MGRDGTPTGPLRVASWHWAAHGGELLKEAGTSRLWALVSARKTNRMARMEDMLRDISIDNCCILGSERNEKDAMWRQGNVF